MAKKGRKKVPKSLKKVGISIKLRPVLIKEIRAKAKYVGMNQSEVIEAILSNAIDNANSHLKGAILA